MTKNNTNPTEKRKQLLSNGYTPLPLLSNGKGLYLKGWSTQDVDDEWLNQFARRADYQNTGIRCDQLAAFDIDITDEDLAGDAEALIEDHCKQTDLCRFGSAPKRLLLYRLKGKPPFKSIRTPKYEGGHRVELLCGRGRQFAAFGQHPGGFPYAWDGPTPLDVPHDKLPAISYKVACDAIMALEEWFEDSGLAIESPGLAFGHAGRQEWDLTDDFECLIDGTIVEWGELRAQLDSEGVFGNIKRENGEFGDSDAVHFMLAKGSGEPCIHDFVRDCTHWDQTVSPDLAAALPDLPDVNTFTPDGLADLMENWALLKDNTVRHIDEPQRTFQLSHFKAAMQHLVIPAPTAQNPLKTEPAVNAWQRDRNTLRADYAALRPDSEEVIVKGGKLTVFNTYAPPVHPDSGGSTNAVQDLIDHLLPNETERQLFIDWHSLKLAHPSWRMHALITVTRAHGTGRGTWFQIIEQLFGGAYVRSVDLSDLIGEGSQAQFNDFLADSLIVYVPEALEEKEDRSRWTSRHVAYERLKQCIEPQASQKYIKRKYGKNSVEWVYSSVLLSSNHIDALAIEPGDRRVIVLDNCETALWDAPSDLYSRIHEWLKDDRNIGALERELRLNAVAAESRYDPFGQPPETHAKARMIEAGQSDTDAAYEYMVEVAAGDLVTPAQWRMFAQQARTQLQLDLPIGEKLDAALTAVMQKRARRIEALGSKQIKIDGTPVRPWIIRDFERWKSNTDTAQIRAEVLKNGNAAATVTPFDRK